MKKGLRILAVSAMLLGLGFANVAMAEEAVGPKYAVVDVQKVVANSKQVKALKNEQEKQAKELAKWIETAKADVEKQKTDEARERVAKKYDTQLAKKREVNAETYAKKLTAIDDSISAVIEKQAKEKGYDMVFSKSTVLYGGDDLTDMIIKVVK